MREFRIFCKCGWCGRQEPCTDTTYGAQTGTLKICRECYEDINAFHSLLGKQPPVANIIDATDEQNRAKTIGQVDSWEPTDI